MLRTPAPYPNVGSWALLDDDGQTLAVRIQLRADGDRATISIPTSFGVASGTRTLSLGELRDPTPLSATEAAELDALERKVAGLARPRKADVERAEALRARFIAAEHLQQLLKRISPRVDPAAAVAARAAA